jgi:hypothetical protein
MSDSEAAFGIFSVQKFNCEYGDSSKFIVCTTPYQVQILHNDLYISIINNSGSAEAKNQGLFIAQIITGKFNSSGNFSLPEIFRNNNLHAFSSNIKYFRGILGIQNGASEWSDKFEKYKGFSMYYLPVDENGGSTIISQIRFNKSNDLKSFLSESGFKVNTLKSGQLFQHSYNGKTVVIKYHAENELLYLESDIKPEKLKKYIYLIKNYE